MPGGYKPAPPLVSEAAVLTALKELGTPATIMEISVPVAGCAACRSAIASVLHALHVKGKVTRWGDKWGLA